MQVQGPIQLLFCNRYWCIVECSACWCSICFYGIGPCQLDRKFFARMCCFEVNYVVKQTPITHQPHISVVSVSREWIYSYCEALGCKSLRVFQNASADRLVGAKTVPIVWMSCIDHLVGVRKPIALGFPCPCNGNLSPYVRNSYPQSFRYRLTCTCFASVDRSKRSVGCLSLYSLFVFGYFAPSILPLMY